MQEQDIVGFCYGIDVGFSGDVDDATAMKIYKFSTEYH